MNRLDLDTNAALCVPDHRKKHREPSPVPQNKTTKNSVGTGHNLGGPGTFSGKIRHKLSPAHCHPKPGSRTDTTWLQEHSEPIAPQPLPLICNIWLPIVHCPLKTPKRFMACRSITSEGFLHSPAIQNAFFKQAVNEGFWTGSKSRNR